MDRKNLLIRGAVGLGAIIGSAALSLVPERVGTALAASSATTTIIKKCGRLCPIYGSYFCDWTWTICAVDGLQSHMQHVVWMDCQEIWYICEVRPIWTGSCCPNPPYYV